MSSTLESTLSALSSLLLFSAVAREPGHVDEKASSSLSMFLSLSLYPCFSLILTLLLSHYSHPLIQHSQHFSLLAHTRIGYAQY